jgi:carbon storage regulator CsrA
MLVLSRKRGEGIVIPSCSVTVTIVAVEGNRVRLGIVAPEEVAVLRGELVGPKERGAAKLLEPRGDGSWDGLPSPSWVKEDGLGSPSHNH